MRILSADQKVTVDLYVVQQRLLAELDVESSELKIDVDKEDEQ